MRTSTKLLRLCAVVPAGLAGSVVALMGFGFLPDLAELAAWAMGLALVLVLSFGMLEPPAARVLGFARALRRGERALLTPAVRLVEQAGLRVDRVLVRLVETDGPLVQPIGRGTVIIDPWLVHALQRRAISLPEAAAAMAHAVAALRVGPARFDLAARLWAFPWTILATVCRLIAEAFSWLPAGRLAWKLRIIVGGVALVRGFQNRQPGTGVGAAALVAVSNVAPAANKAWCAIIERDADAVVAAHHLGEPRIRLLQRFHVTKPLERVHRIRGTSVVLGEVGPRVGAGGRSRWRAWSQHPNDPLPLHGLAALRPNGP
jgi:hypothetical protein